MGDCIFAKASGFGSSGVSVIRISGTDALRLQSHLWKQPITVGKPALRNILSHDGTVIDQALILSFPKGASFTGEEVLETSLPRVIGGNECGFCTITGFGHS